MELCQETNIHIMLPLQFQSSNFQSAALPPRSEISRNISTLWKKECETRLL